MALADSYIMLLAPDTGNFLLYQQAYIVLIVLSVDALLTIGGGFFSSIIQGFEGIDLGSKITFRRLIKSKLFQAYCLPYLQASLTLPLSFYVLTTYTPNLPLESAFWVCVINTAAHIVTLSVLFLIARRTTQIVFPWTKIAKYLFASSAMGAVLFLWQPHPTRISMILVETAVGGLVYFGLLLALDKESRELFKAVLYEVKVIMLRRKIR